MTARQRRIYWNRERNKAVKYITKYQRSFYNALQSDMQGFQDALRESEQAARKYVNNLLFSDGISRVMNQIIRDVAVRYARTNYNTLRKEKQFNTSEEWVQLIMEYLGTNFYNNGVLQIVKTSRAMMLDILERGNREGWGYSDYAEYITRNVPGLNSNRADMIARTEVGRAIHAGTFVGADKSPFEKQKMWVAAKDNRTRGNPINGQKDKADHWHLDGQTVDFNDKFVDRRSGTELDHPHDPQAKAVDVIRCRCTFVVINKRDKNGNLIRKNTGMVLPISRPLNVPPPPPPQEIRNGFVPAKTREEAIAKLTERNININAKSMSVGHLNKIIEAVDNVPQKAKPTLIVDKAGYESIVGRKINRTGDSWQGMANSIEIFDRSTRQYKLEKILVINTKSFKNPIDLVNKKIEYNNFYSTQTNGKKWYLNEFEGSTHYHEMGHLYDTNISTRREWIEIANRWHKESNADMIKVTKSEFKGENGGEAFAEAFAMYYGNNKKGLPDYVLNYLNNILR